MNDKRHRVFVSYSHKDAVWLDRLQAHLAPLVREEAIDLWADTRIKAGANWRREIDQALRLCNSAVLLISADFLASDFAMNDELPSVLNAAVARGARVLPVIVRPCLFSEHRELGQYQSINSPTRPLSAMRKHQWEAALLKLAQSIAGDVNAHTTVGDVNQDVSAVSADKSMWKRVVGLVEDEWKGKPRRQLVAAVVQLRATMMECQSWYETFKAESVAASSQPKYPRPRVEWVRSLTDLGRALARLDEVLSIFSPTARQRIEQYVSAESLELGAMGSLGAAAHDLGATTDFDIASGQLNHGFNEALLALDGFIRQNFQAEEIFEASQSARYW